MTDAELLQQHLNLMRGEPVVPLTDAQAAKQAYTLRMRGMSYSSLALVMGIYHGQWYCSERWADTCRELGAPLTKGPRRGLRGVSRRTAA